MNGKDNVEESVIEQYEQKFNEAINDDLNMPVAMSVVWDVIKNPSKSKELADLLMKFDTVLGLKINETPKVEDKIPEEVLELVEKRKKARSNKDWNLSDRLREEINKLGYTVKDEKDGMKVEKN